MTKQLIYVLLIGLGLIGLVVAVTGTIALIMIGAR